MDGTCCVRASRTRTFCRHASLLVAAQKCLSGARPLALWRAGLLLSVLGLCATSEPGCVLGTVGRPVSLPCFRPELRTAGRLTVEWRRDGELLLRSAWEEGGEHEEMWGFSPATLAADAAAARSGDFTLKLPDVEPQRDANYSLFVLSEGNRSVPVCTVCLRTAAGFSSPRLQREEGLLDNHTSFLCESGGGFPEPTVSWLINEAEEPPEGAVATRALALASLLYNVSSSLSVALPGDASVSCIISNPVLNQTLVSTSYGGGGGPPRSRASQAMWMFSTGLCVVVGAMVVAGVAYQIHLDRISKKKKKEFQATQRGYKRRRPPALLEETEAMKPPASKETNV